MSSNDCVSIFLGDFVYFSIIFVSIERQTATTQLLYECFCDQQNRFFFYVSQPCAITYQWMVYIHIDPRGPSGTDTGALSQVVPEDGCQREDYGQSVLLCSKDGFVGGSGIAICHYE